MYAIRWTVSFACYAGFIDEGDNLMQLYIGNKNYSSWSLRPWLGMKVAGIEFDEYVHNLYAVNARAEGQ